MFGLCFVWVYTIKGEFAPCLSLQASAGFVSMRSHACRIASYVCPKSFYVKGNKTAYLGFYCRTILRQYAVRSLFISERLEMTDQRFK